MEGNLTVYTASAGSGKTFTLAAEYIALLLQGNPKAFRNILAVTFTNKATAEMKERILQNLYEIGHTAPERCGILQAVKERMGEKPPLDAVLQERAREVLLEILHDYDAFRIETIDSFFQSLLSNLAHELGLAANFRLELNPADVIRKAVERLMVNAKDDTEMLRRMTHYVERNIEDDKSWDFRRELCRFAENLISERYIAHADTIEQEIAHLNDYQSYMMGVREELLDIQVSAAEQLAELLEPYADVVKNYNALAKYILAVRQRSRAQIDHIEGQKTIPALVADDPAELKSWRKAPEVKKGTMLEECRQMQEALQTAYGCSRHIRETNTRLQLLNPLHLLIAVKKEMDAINDETNHFLLGRTPQFFHELVGKEDASFVFERAGTRFNNIMIDEFQDTSRLQWENFKHLLLENTSAGQKNLLVGDVKQSIYRWRNGDWHILGNIEQEFQHQRIEKRTLETNYRSDEAIVHFNNDFFVKSSKVLQSFLDDEESIPTVYNAEGEHQSVAQRTKSSVAGKGYVRLRFDEKSEKGKGDAEGDAPVDRNAARLTDLEGQIERLHAQGVSYNDMAILVRSKTDADKVMAHFANNTKGIVLVSSEAYRLNASPAVLMLAHALNALKTYSIDNRKWSRQASLGFLVKEYQQRILDSGKSLEEIMADIPGNLPPAFFSERDELVKMPLFELCQRLILLFDLQRMKGQSPYLFFFLDCVLDYLNENASHIDFFLKYWDETLFKQAIPSSIIEGIQVMTVHKSKGLDFHTVFVPFADWALNEVKDSLVWSDKNGLPEEMENNVPIVPIQLTSKLKGTCFDEELRQEQIELSIENYNIAYVAFTRPKHNLFIWTKSVNPNGNREKIYMSDLLDAFVGNASPSSGSETIYEWGTPFAPLPEAGLPQLLFQEERPANPLEVRGAVEEKVELRTYASKIEFKQSNEARKYVFPDDEPLEIDRTRYIQEGLLFHEIFSAIHTTEDVKPTLDALLNKGVIAAKGEAEEYYEKIMQRLSDARIQPWFDGSYTLFNECTILSRTAAGTLEERRPDRVMLREEETIVVDYKFGNPDARYHQQVEEYKTLLERMGYPHVRGYLWYFKTNDIVAV